VDPRRRIFCNRTLNLRAIKAVGYDMDYTLIHYVVPVWERHAYEHVRRVLGDRGFPVEGLQFDPELMIRGLIIDSELGNILKANRFGYVNRALHGTRPIPFEEVRRVYARTMVDLSESRYAFMNTLFSLSEACLYAQLVDRLDAGVFSGPVGYQDLYKAIRSALDYAHMEGRLKQEIIEDPDRFVELDPDTPLALLDQKESGKKILLITNSEWTYTDAMMRYAFEPHLPSGGDWRELFDLVIVGARKPIFFTAENPIMEVVTDDGLLRPVVDLSEGRIFYGASADAVERFLGVEGDEILYVGDHIYSDLHVSNRVQRWRTALVLRELEKELDAVASFAARQLELEELMARKELLEADQCQLKLTLQRMGTGRMDPADQQSIIDRLNALRSALTELDSKISPLARAAGELASETWGLLLRAGNDKSHLARQVERYADVYLSRVSNFLYATPFAYLRSSRGSLPHDPT
jgi:HAD superfamily 5'-nucleotidase-like hydrolase